MPASLEEVMREKQRIMETPLEETEEQSSPARA
jgi:hypothetical protein